MTPIDMSMRLAQYTFRPVVIRPRLFSLYSELDNLNEYAAKIAEDEVAREVNRAIVAWFYMRDWLPSPSTNDESVEA